MKAIQALFPDVHGALVKDLFKKISSRFQMLDTLQDYANSLQNRTEPLASDDPLLVALDDFSTAIKQIDDVVNTLVKKETHAIRNLHALLDVLTKNPAAFHVGLLDVLNETLTSLEPYISKQVASLKHKIEVSGTLSDTEKQSKICKIDAKQLLLLTFLSDPKSGIPSLVRHFEEMRSLKSFPKEHALFKELKSFLSALEAKMKPLDDMLKEVNALNTVSTPTVTATTSAAAGPAAPAKQEEAYRI